MLGREPATLSITIRVVKDIVSELNAVAHALGRSCTCVINQALKQYLDVNASQVKRIKEGISHARAGRVHPADKGQAEIAARHDFGSRCASFI